MRNDKSQEIFVDGQVAKSIYLRNMSAMKDILNLGEIKFGDRHTDAYKYFKKVVMDAFYTAMLDIFAAYEKEGLVKKCSCGTSIRQGYKQCLSCNGAGFCNTDEFMDWFKSSSQPEEPEEVKEQDEQQS